MTSDFDDAEKAIERKIERKLMHRRRGNFFAGITLVGFIGWCLIMPFVVFVLCFYAFEEKIKGLPTSGKALIVFGCFVIGAFNTTRYVKKEHDILRQNFPDSPSPSKKRRIK